MFDTKIHRMIYHMRIMHNLHHLSNSSFEVAMEMIGAKSLLFNFNYMLNKASVNVQPKCEP